MISAWASSNQVVLGQLKTKEKSNEITAIPHLLRLPDISGCIITIDAMGTQKKIAQTIIKNDGDYILAVKENHKTLYPVVNVINLTARFIIHVMLALVHFVVSFKFPS